ncbi:hypothetical protein [Streptomyces lavendulocolor]|uniref:hypothetical protein n=1 Tax=Streptomyces lavendulocolor TaxID=67316 RepID=UPI003C2C6830
MAEGERAAAAMWPGPASLSSAAGIVVAGQAEVTWRARTAPSTGHRPHPARQPPQFAAADYQGRFSDSVSTARGVA